MSDSTTPVPAQPATSSTSLSSPPGASASGVSALADSVTAWWTGMPRVVFTWVLAIDALWLGLYVIGVIFFSKNPNVSFLLSLEREGNPSTWWYGSQQLLVALAFLCLTTRLFDSDVRIRPFRSLFLVSALGFGFISLDEVGEIHEIGSRIIVLNKPIGRFLENFEHNVFHVKHRIHGGGIWIVVYGIIGVILLFWLVPQVVRAFKQWPKEVSIVGAGFLVFAFSAVALQVYGYFTKVGTFKHTAYVFISQGLKMGGMSVALYGALLVLAAGAVGLARRLSMAEDQPAA